MQPFERRSVRYWSKESNGTRIGGQKRNFFNSRPTMGPWSVAAAPVESCQSLPNRSPWGRLGSVLDTRERLRRMRRRLKHFWSISLSRPLGLAIFWPYLRFVGILSPSIRKYIFTESTARSPTQRRACGGDDPRIVKFKR